MLPPPRPQRVGAPASPGRRPSLHSTDTMGRGFAASRAGRREPGRAPPGDARCAPSSSMCSAAPSSCTQRSLKCGLASALSLITTRLTGSARPWLRSHRSGDVRRPLSTTTSRSSARRGERLGRFRQRGGGSRTAGGRTCRPASAEAQMPERAPAAGSRARPLMPRLTPNGGRQITPSRSTVSTGRSLTSRRPRDPDGRCAI